MWLALVTVLVAADTDGPRKLEVEVDKTADKVPPRWHNDLR